MMLFNNYYLFRYHGLKSQNNIIKYNGASSQTGFFGPVFCQKFQNPLAVLPVIFLLFEHLCVSDMQKYPGQK